MHLKKMNYNGSQSVSSGSKVKPKRILLVIRWPGGGIRTFVRYVYRNFDSFKWQFTIIAPDSDGLKLLTDDLANLNVTCVPVRGIPTDGSSGAAILFRQIAREIRKGKYDLVHSHGFISGMCTAFPALLSGLPHLMTSHDVLNEKQILGLKGKFKKQVMGRVFKFVDIIHSVSYDAQENLFANFPHLGDRAGKCLVITNGIEVERFVQTRPRSLKDDLGLEDNVFLIGFLGRFMSQKGFRYLIDAIDILRQNICLSRKPLVLGFGDGCFLRQEKQAIKERGLEGYFRFMPFTPNVAGTIKGLDVVVMPSLWEACPLLPMETLVCGTPFIGTDCIGLREVVRDTPAKIVPKADSVALSQAILQEMATNRKEIFMSFREEAANRFNVARTSQQISQLYEKLT